MYETDALPTSMSKTATRMVWTWTDVTLEIPDNPTWTAQEYLEFQIQSSQTANVDVWGPSGFNFVEPTPDYSGLGANPPINVSASNGTYPFLIKIDYDLPQDYPGFTCIVLRSAMTPHVEDSNPTIPSVCLVNGLFERGPRCYYVTNSLAPQFPDWPAAEKQVAADCTSGGNFGDVFFPERRYFWVEVFTGDVTLISDPGDHGFFGGSLSSTSSTTTTTMPIDVCGDADASGRVSATDALLTLRTAVGLAECAVCICDANGSSEITASDALSILKVAVGQAFVVQCPDCL
ncbi:MAG: hypothetical protein ACI8TX_001871 [Hyphomicrobiaceae bacterium]